MNISDTNDTLATNSFSRAQVYTDFAGLGELSAKGNADSSEALHEVARQFESIFLSIALKSMRSANEAFAKDSYFDSSESNLYRDMLDQQLSLTLTQGKGMGLAQSLYNQLSQYLPENQSSRTSSGLNLEI